MLNTIRSRMMPALFTRCRGGRNVPPRARRAGPRWPAHRRHPHTSRRTRRRCGSPQRRLHRELRALITRSAPASARARASARPSPSLAPVTIAVRPRRSPRSSWFPWQPEDLLRDDVELDFERAATDQQLRRGQVGLGRAPATVTSGPRPPRAASGPNHSSTCAVASVMCCADAALSALASTPGFRPDSRLRTLRCASASRAPGGRRDPTERRQRVVPSVRVQRPRHLDRIEAVPARNRGVSHRDPLVRQRRAGHLPALSGRTHQVGVGKRRHRRERTSLNMLSPFASRSGRTSTPGADMSTRKS